MKRRLHIETPNAIVCVEFVGLSAPCVAILAPAFVVFAVAVSLAPCVKRFAVAS